MPISKTRIAILERAEITGELVNCNGCTVNKPHDVEASKLTNGGYYCQDCQDDLNRQIREARRGKSTYSGTRSRYRKDGLRLCVGAYSREVSITEEHYTKKENFGNGKCKEDGLNSLCKECIRSYRLYTNYGLIPKIEVEFRTKHNNVCGLCGMTEKEHLSWRRHSLCIDHTVINGEIVLRGILCEACNLDIGKLGDDLESLKKVVAYLEKSI